MLIDPNDMAPVVKRFTISLAGSTSSSGTGFLALLDHHQAAQCAQVAALLVDQVGVFLESLEAALPHGMLQFADRSGIQQVIFAIDAEMILAADREFGFEFRERLEGVLMLHLRLARQHVQSDTFQARSRPGKVAVDQFLVQADGFEDLRTAIALQGRDAHLREGLQQSLVDGL